MTITEDDLRPVESLWILNREGKQNWTRESCLKAVLVDLATRGLIEPEDDEETFEPTGEEPSSELREYEKEVLEAIEGEDDQQRMVNAVYEFDFESFFVERGLLNEQTAEKDLSIFSFTLYEWTDTEIVESDRYDTFVADILETEGDLRLSFEKGELESNKVPMVFAFQYSDWFAEFEDSDVEETVIDPESVEATTESVATSGAYVATNAAAVAAASSASAACASSAAASCSGAAGAGAAGAGAA